MHSTSLLRCVAMILGLALLAAQPAHADCSAANESCTSSCNGSLTSGFIVGLGGALGRSNQAYQEGMRQLQQAEACAQRCSAQYDACYQQEQVQRQREEAARRAQQQRAEAQQRAEQQRAEAQQRAQFEREALKRRANRVISPPVTPPLAIKDAAPLLQQAQAHDKDGNPVAAAHIYKMIVQGSTQPKHLQAARAALRRQALDELNHMGTREPRAYGRILSEYGPLGIFTPSEQTQLAAMAPDAERSEDAARNYLRTSPKGTLRDVAEAVIKAAPEMHEQKAVEQQRAEELQRQEAATGFIAIGSNGNPTAPGSHACVKDRKTGLLWSTETMIEMKWDSAMRQGIGYSRCGFSTGWRLPDKDELLSLVVKESPPPKIDTRYFPDTKADAYWSSSPYADNAYNAWLVSFVNGEANDYSRSLDLRVRLVRAGQ